MYKYSYTLGNDVSEIKKINEKYLPENYKYTLWFEIVKNFPKYNFVCKKDNVIIGYVLGCPNFLEEKPDEIILMSIAIEKEYRRKGIAKNLIKLFLKSVGEKKCILQVRESNKAISLYESLGFKQETIYQKYYKDGENALMMRYQKYN
jgi:ribosomal protein S18 acetylase RimI-like enzyme